VAARRNHVEYQNALQNVNLVAYDIRYLTRHPSGVVLSANASRESDTGGVAPRQRLLTSLKAQWRYRRFSLSAELANTRETQGSNARTRAQGQVFLKREI
jgi:hypothetical protein